MHLKRIELHGFKSFADKSVIEFQSGITGIVGPNGCGKSNISDAVRWVLGEQSIKSLRGSTMSDVIFNGSEDRKPHNLAEVTLVFDNEDRYMNMDYNEIEITRRLYRQNNQGEYLINNEPCRLKDITDLIMDTGMGRDSLSIISQGNISSFADSKPEDRRGMFEEAAGVAKYKKRKIESIRKLERAQNNLERVQDICNELEKQIIPLKKQKEKAEIYLDLKEKLESVEISVLVKEIDRYSTSLKELNSSIEDLSKEQVEVDGKVIVFEHQSETIQTKINELDQEISEIQNELFAALNNSTMLEKQKIEIDATRKLILESTNKEDLAKRIEQTKLMVIDIAKEYNGLVARYKEAKQEKLDLEAKDEKVKRDIESLRKDGEKTNITLHQLRTQRSQLQNEIDNKSSYSHGVRAIIDASESLPGIVGVFGDLLKYDEKYEAALSVALGNAVQFVVTKTNHDARNAISFLKRNKSGRATFLPIDTMQERSLREDHMIVATSLKGYMGVLSDYVSSSTPIQSIISNQLGNVILTDTIEHASAISQALYARYKVVTMDGDIVNVGGSLTGGSKRNISSSLSSKRLLEKVNKDIEVEEEKFRLNKELFANKENEGREIAQALLQKQISFARIEMETSQKQNELEIKKKEYQELSNQEVELDDLESDKKGNELIHLINEANKLKDTLTEQSKIKMSIRYEYYSQNEKIKDELKVLRKELRQVESQLNEHKVKKASLDTELKNILNRLNEEYKMTYEFAVTQVNQDINLENAKEEVRILRNQISELGHVNVEAIEEYAQKSERYETTNNQRLELISASNKILEAINEMDSIMIDKFTTTFNKINYEFNHVFRSLFGGGKAELRYSDPENILETGIDIDVQPPGKAVQNISLFSGGEKALIAISCLFAILRVRPVPLCILDEVEAALDVANVERFARFLREFSQTTQFIVVTHREGTMEECDLLYGATMQQKGVTKLVSVKLKDAISLAEDN